MEDNILEPNINVFDELKKVLITNDAEYKRYFILSYYQTIPKYYFLSSDRINNIIYNFSVGSGKTAAAMFAIINNVDTYKKNSFNNKFIKNTVNKINIKKNVYVIGSWVTTNAVINELMKEEFDIVDPYKVKYYKTLLNSPVLEDRQKGEQLKGKRNEQKKKKKKKKGKKKKSLVSKELCCI